MIPSLNPFCMLTTRLGMRRSLNDTLRCADPGLLVAFSSAMCPLPPLCPEFFELEGELLCDIARGTDGWGASLTGEASSSAVGRVVVEGGREAERRDGSGSKVLSPLLAVGNASDTLRLSLSLDMVDPPLTNRHPSDTFLPCFLLKLLSLFKVDLRFFSGTTGRTDAALGGSSRPRSREDELLARAVVTRLSARDDTPNLNVDILLSLSAPSAKSRLCPLACLIPLDNVLSSVTAVPLLIVLQ